MSAAISSLCAPLHINSVCASGGDPQVPDSWEWGEKPELCLYRGRTIGMLRRYLHLATDSGKLPSILGSEFFRTRVTSYRLFTFEDIVIFVHDVERCLEKLDKLSQQVIARKILQEYTEQETAGLLGCSERHVRRILLEALDHLSEIFLTSGIMRSFGEAPPEKEEKSCQEGEIDENSVMI
jgi:Sigma-70, region 4